MNAPIPVQAVDAAAAIAIVDDTADVPSPIDETSAESAVDCAFPSTLSSANATNTWSFALVTTTCSLSLPFGVTRLFCG